MSRADGVATPRVVVDGCTMRGMRLSRVSLCVAIAMLVILQLLPLQRQLMLLDTFGSAHRNGWHAEPAFGACGLICTLGGGVEPGFPDDTAPLLVVPPAMELLVPQQLTGRPAQCSLGKAVLQLPPGIVRLARAELDRDGRERWLLPNGALLRVPLPDARERVGWDLSASQSCLTEASIDDSGSSDTLARQVVSQRHARCNLPVGALLSTRVGATTSSSIDTDTPGVIDGTASIMGGDKTLTRAECTARLSSSHAGGFFSRGRGRDREGGVWFRTRSLSLPRLDGGGRVVLTATAAVAQPSSSLDDAALPAASTLGQLRRPADSQLNTTARQQRSQLIWPTLSALFPLPPTLELPRSSRDALHHLLMQLDSLETGHGSGGEDGRKVRVQLLLLGHRPLCDESAFVVNFLSAHRNVMHLAFDSAPTTTFNPDVMLAWSVLAPSGYRILADGASRLPEAALRARLTLLHDHADCDAMFVAAGATEAPHRYDVETVRSWQFFEVARPASTNTASPPPMKSPLEWLPRSAVVKARVPRGPWPVWQTSTLPQECRLGISTSVDAAADHDDGRTVAEADVAHAGAAAAAEVDYWLGCLQAGAVICLARPSLNTHTSSSKLLEEADESVDGGIPIPDGNATTSISHPRWVEIADSGLASAGAKIGSGWVEQGPDVVEGPALERVLQRRHHLASLRILIASSSLPTQALGGGDNVRGFQLASELASEGHAVTVTHVQPALSVAHTAALRDAGWRTFCPACSLQAAAICSTCNEEQPAAHVQCRLQATSRLAHRPTVVQLPDEADLSAVRGDLSTTTASFDLIVVLVESISPCIGQLSTAESLIASIAGRSLSTKVMTPRVLAVSDEVHWTRRTANCSSFMTAEGDLSATVAAIRSRELELYSNADLTLTLTDEDRDIFNRLRPGLSLRTLPYGLASPPTAALAAGFAERAPVVLFVGSYRVHHRRVVRWLIRQVWPLVVARAPGASLRLAGSSQWRSEALAAKSSGVAGVRALETTGGSSSLLHALRGARVMVSPALAAASRLPVYGSLLAMTHGVPLVTTPVGSRGLLASRTPGAVAIAKTSAEFAQQLAVLLSNDTAWERQRGLARDHVAHHVGERSMLKQLRRSVAAVMAAGAAVPRQEEAAQAAVPAAN